ncbi:early estrogen-induced gene 1 protein-like isoform X2 [Liolophura sinensis]|uniref:early estrogen-induced gene 1 protein-like isoform X2 n=1 Tax=Liolophura sinensis TaxID=3198878 RepID=UPI003158B521
MAFMIYKKKRFKFQVNFELEELSSVPFVSGILFAKVRLLEGGSFTEHSSRDEVKDHCVRWQSKFLFQCKLTASAHTGVLEPCMCRVSVRKELKGGRSYQKLGYADINLAQFAGAGMMSRRYLLEGYDYKHRQDNSTLKVTIDMSLVSGDPVFKVPSNQIGVRKSGDIGEELQPEGKVEECSEGSLASGSSGFGSLPRKDKPNVNALSSGSQSSIQTDSDRPVKESAKDFELGHSRSASQASQQSRVSGYGSLPHSRQSSVGGDITHGHTRSPSVGSATSDIIKAERRRKFEETLKERRVDATRVNAEDLVEQLIQDTDLGADEGDESSGLQLLVGKDGTTALR